MGHITLTCHVCHHPIPPNHGALVLRLSDVRNAKLLHDHDPRATPHASPAAPWLAYHYACQHPNPHDVLEVIPLDTLQSPADLVRWGETLEHHWWLAITNWSDLVWSHSQVPMPALLPT